MRWRTAFALFFLGLLAGCTEAPAPKAVEAAPQPEAKHSYRLYGSPEKGEFMIDAATGAVWQYEEVKDHQKAFVAVPVLKTKDSTSDDPLGVLGNR